MSSHELQGALIQVQGRMIEVSSFQRTQQSRCSPPLTWGRNQAQFPKRCFLVFRTPDDGQSPETQQLLSVTHYRQNPLDSKRIDVDSGIFENVLFLVNSTKK
jgi:hypothetical protein